MRKKMASLLLSVTVAVSGMTMPVMAEDFSDSVVVEQDTEETDVLDSEETVVEAEDEDEQGTDADVTVEDEQDEGEESAAVSDDAEENFDDGEEADLFTSEESTADAAGTVGGNINWNYPDGLIPTDTSVASDGCVLVGVMGTYIADAKNALDQINKYRKEACEKGYPDPRNSKRKLTKLDYVPIKWSSDLEYIARIRAAEASVVMDHTRPNGQLCFSLTSPNGISSNAEVLAWDNTTSSSMLSGIQMWYAEKNDWVKKNTDNETGHYTAMINPDNRYVGLGCFVSEISMYAKTTAGEFSALSNLDESKAPAMKDYIQVIEAQTSGLSPRVLLADEEITKGKTTAGVLVLIADTNATFWLDEVSWTSSNTNVATVDQNGLIRGVGAGKATIIAKTDTGIKVSETITVKQPIVYLSKTKITIGNCTYTGANVKPSVKITYGSQTLKAGRDYTYTYTKASQAGKPIKVTIKGKGSYRGTVTRTVKIAAKSVSKVTVRRIPKVKYAMGKAIRPTVAVYDGKRKLSAANYKVTYGKNTVPGKATIKITGKGNYKGSISKTFYIAPAKASIRKVSAGKNKFMVSCRKMAGVSGYQIAYSTSKNSGFSYVNVSAQTAGLTVTELMSKKIYYVKVRAYKTVDGKTLYGKYSEIQKVKIK